MKEHHIQETKLSSIQELDFYVADFLEEIRWKSDPENYDLQRRLRTVPLEGERCVEATQYRNARSHLITGNQISLFDNNDNRPPVTDLGWGPSVSEPLPTGAEVIIDALKEALSNGSVEGKVVDDSSTDSEQDKKE